MNDERLTQGWDWSGYLTIENGEAVTERIRSLIGGGQRYTFVAVNDLFGDRPEVRTSQTAKSVEHSFSGPYDDGSRCVHLTVPDTYGVWGLHTGAADADAARRMRDDDRRDWVFLEFTHGKLAITHYAPSGNRLFWTIAVEDGTRLKAAEDVAVLYGWTGDGNGNSPRGKALFEVWSRWYDLVGSAFLTPDAHPDLNDEEIARLAAQRDETRARTLAKLRGEDG